MTDQLDTARPYYAQEMRLRELAQELNGEEIITDYIVNHRQGSDDTDWNTNQFERWLIGVMRKAAALETAR